MDDTEARALLDATKTLIAATNGPHGAPHLAPMWFGLDDGDIVMWTYGASQKVVNLRRDPRITCLAETGEIYEQLRGVEISGRAELVDDQERVLAIGAVVMERYELPEGTSLEKMGAKRVGIRVHEERRASWDHRKLGGGY